MVEALGRGAVRPHRPLSALAGALRPLLPELSAVLPPALESLDDPAAQRHRLFRALKELLGALGPVNLVLEDLHWADEHTVEFLQFLAPQLPDNLAVVLAWRREDLPLSSPMLGLGARLGVSTMHASVGPAPLDAHDVRDLIGAILGTGEVSEEFAAYLHERTGGLPFALEEVVRLLQERDDLVFFDGRWARRELHRLEVPPAVREAVLERLRSLSADARILVQAAAVLDAPSSDEIPLPQGAVPDPHPPSGSEAYRVPGGSLASVEKFYAKAMPPGHPYKGIKWCTQYSASAPSTITRTWVDPRAGRLLAVAISGPQAGPVIMISEQTGSATATAGCGPTGV